MKKVVYLHGLETKSGGKKVDYLTKDNLVYAPRVDYKNVDEFYKYLKIITEIKPDYIIGSSFGGYFAYLYGTLIDTNVILFNPALHSRSYEPKIETGIKSPKGICILGEDDSVIDPIVTKKIIVDNKYKFDINKLKIETIKSTGHRTSLVSFKKIINTHLI